LETDGRTRGGGQDTTPKDVHDFHRQGTRPITKKRAAPLLVLPFSFIYIHPLPILEI
jgi:hypothetical protein